MAKVTGEQVIAGHPDGMRRSLLHKTGNITFLPFDSNFRNCIKLDQANLLRKTPAQVRELRLSSSSPLVLLATT